MTPAFAPDQIVLGCSPYRRLRPRDIVILFHDGQEKIKRIQEVRPGFIFVVGDNLTKSTDSRSFGWLPAAAVRAKVIWPRR